MAVWGGLTNSCDSPWQWLNQTCCCCCSVAKSYSLLLHGLQHARLFCTPLSPGVCSDSCPLSQWCYLTISSSATLFSFCLQSFPASRSFPVRWLFISGGQSIGTSVLASVIPMKIHGWFPSGLTDLTSLQSKELSGVLSSTAIRRYQFFGHQPSFWSNSHIHRWWLEKP